MLTYGNKHFSAIKSALKSAVGTPDTGENCFWSYFGGLIFMKDGGSFRQMLSNYLLPVIHHSKLNTYMICMDNYTSVKARASAFHWLKGARPPAESSWKRITRYVILNADGFARSIRAARWADQCFASTLHLFINRSGGRGSLDYNPAWFHTEYDLKMYESEGPLKPLSVMSATIPRLQIQIVPGSHSLWLFLWI